MVTGINQDNLLRQWQQRQATGYNNVGTFDPTGGIPQAGGTGAPSIPTPTPQQAWDQYYRWLARRSAASQSGSPDFMDYVAKPTSPDPYGGRNPFQSGGTLGGGISSGGGLTGSLGGTPDPTAGMPQASGPINQDGPFGPFRYGATATPGQTSRTGGTFDPTAGQVWQGIGQSSGPGGQRAGAYGNAPTSSGSLGGSIGGGGITGSLGGAAGQAYGNLLGGGYPQQPGGQNPYAYNPMGRYIRNPQTGQMTWVTPAEENRWAGLTGYTAAGTPTYGREQWTAAQMGMLGGQQTLAGRQQTLSEQLGLGNLGIASAAQRLDELVRTGQLSIQQRNQALQELQNRQQYGLQQGGLTGYYGGQQTLEGELGRGNLDLARTQADRDWYYRQAQLLSNPENFAMTAALRGAAPWQAALQGVQPNDPQSMGQDPAREVARRSAPNMMQRLTTSERGAFGSALRAGGTTTEDYQEQVRRYTPTSSGFRTGGFR